jgi:tetratricopeptide (TPR) repeat protein
VTVLRLPKRQGPRLSALRLAREPACAVLTLMRNADDLYRAALLIDDKEPERAEIMYTACLMSHPGHARAMVNLGNIHFRRGHEDAAKYLYGKARQADPMLPEAHYNLGCLALEDGELSDAVDLFETATRLDPSFPDAHTNLALARKRRDAEWALELDRIQETL